MAVLDGSGSLHPVYLIASCANSDEVLQQNLLASPDIQSGLLPIRVIRNAASAACAYASVIDEGAADFVILAHQDAYLPKDFKARLDVLICELNETTPSWGVLGVYGSTASGSHVGYIYDGSNGRVLGTPVVEPVPVVVLDEVLIIVRVASGVNFDPRLPGFHLYGTQIAMAAREKGREVLVGDVRIIHNSRSILDLGKDYEAAWLYLAGAWNRNLPQPNLCCGLTTRSRWPLWKWRIKNKIKLRMKRRKLFERVAEVQALARSEGFE